MSHIAKAWADMRESGGDPYGIICSPHDKAQMEQYGVPVRVSHYAPKGSAWVVDREAWNAEFGVAPSLKWEEL